jgi:hypothetical protein
MGNILTACTSKKHYVNMPDKLEEIVVKPPDVNVDKNDVKIKSDQTNVEENVEEKMYEK